MIIKATRLQAWAPAGGGGKSRPSPPPSNKSFWLYWRPFCYFFFIWGLFYYVFLHMGAFLLRFSHFRSLFFIWGPFCYFYFMVGAFFCACPPPPPPMKISEGTHDCKEGSRACSPEIFLCNRNSVSSGHVLLRFCLKNDKNNDKL